MQDSKLRQLKEKLEKEQREEDNLFSDIAERATVESVRYALFIDTYNLFCQANEGLDPVFKKWNDGINFTKINLGEPKMLRKPSVGEYVGFAKLFLNRVRDSFETVQLKKFPSPISESKLKEIIRQLSHNPTSTESIPNSKTIVRFESETHLFGAKFDKEKIVQELVQKREKAWHDIRRQEVDRLIQKVSDENTIVVGDRTKNYTFYNEFLTALTGRRQLPRLPGVYKFNENKGAFSYFSEKGVDVSFAIKSVEKAYEDPELHQLFCISDTDFVPVFDKLEKMGINFSIIYINPSWKFPPEFKRYKATGKLTFLQFEDLCEQVIEDIVHSFMHGGDFLYEGDNKDVYSLVANKNLKELYQEWNGQQQERYRIYCESLLKEMDRNFDG